MTKHTPGPWIRDGLTIYALMHSGWRKGVEQFRNRFHLHLSFDRECKAEEVEANATLIEAAPDLLAAAKIVLDGLNARIDSADGHHVPVFDGIAELHDAIAKAEGLIPACNALFGCVDGDHSGGCPLGK